MQLAQKTSSHAHHWRHNSQHLCLWENVFYGWLLRVQPNQDVPRGWKAYFILDTVGVFCYTVMPFGLKNAGATYQRAMNTIFLSHLRKMVECYVDDIAIKGHDKNDHLRDLKIMFDIMQTYQLKMNPTKSFLSVSSGKLMGFIVTSKRTILTQTRSKLFRACNHLRISKNLGVCKVGWPISENSLQISRVIVNHSPGLWKKVSLLYGIKPAKRLSKILKNTSLRLQSWWLPH